MRSVSHRRTRRIRFRHVNVQYRKLTFDFTALYVDPSRVTSIDLVRHGRIVPGTSPPEIGSWSGVMHRTRFMLSKKPSTSLMLLVVPESYSLHLTPLAAKNPLPVIVISVFPKKGRARGTSAHLEGFARRSRWLPVVYSDEPSIAALMVTSRRREANTYPIVQGTGR